MAQHCRKHSFTDTDHDAVWILHNEALAATGAHAGQGPWDDDLHEIADQYINRGGVFLVGLLEEQVIDLSVDLEPVLEQLRTYRKEQWLKKGKPAPEWIFCNEEGNYLNEFLFRMRKFYALIKAIKMRSFGIHDLRHTYASLMLQNGESVTYLRNRWGTNPSRSRLTPTDT